MNASASMPPAVSKTEEEWQKILSPEQFYVTRKKGTERPFTGKYWNAHEAGLYKCICCGAVLFSSKDKFDSGCGWPSFSDLINKETVQALPDHSHGMIRTEVQCKACGAHLGHLFDDGPQPTGQRYCINSVSIVFEPDPKQNKK